MCDGLSASQFDVPCVRQSMPASLGAVTSRRVKDELNAARKLELVISTTLFSNTVIDDRYLLLEIFNV